MRCGPMSNTVEAREDQKWSESEWLQPGPAVNRDQGQAPDPRL